MADSEPVLCDHVNMLADRLRLDASDQRWLFLLHGALSHQHVGAPLASVPAAILTRLLWRHPGLNPLPAAPAPEDLIDLLSPYWRRREGRAMSASRLAMLTGNASWSGSRWLRGANQTPALTNRRLFLVLALLIEQAGDEGIDLLLRVLDEEASARGHAGFSEVLRRGSWNSEPTDLARAVRREDVADTATMLGLDASDRRWLFLNQEASLRRDGPGEPVRCVPAALLTRLLQLHPEACPLPPQPEPAELVETLKPLWHARGGKRFGASKLAMITGHAAWSGARWMRGDDVRPAPVVRRLMCVLELLAEIYAERTFEILEPILDDEARARGRRDFGEVLRNRRWGSGSGGDEVAEHAA